MVIILISTLWIIEKKDHQQLDLAIAESSVTTELYEQMNTIYEIILFYKDDEIPEEIKELWIRSLRITEDFYGTTLGAVDILHENQRANQAFEIIRGFTETFARESLTQEDYDVMNSYIAQIEDIVELTDKNVNAIESKVNNYWWK